MAISATITAAQELPAGPGREIVTTRCVTCHETDLITQQRLSRAGWGRSVDKMVRWGAAVEAAEREAHARLLAAHFAPTPAASHIVATAGSEAVYKRACLACHEDDLIEVAAPVARRLGARGGQDDPLGRRRCAAADKEALVDYLAARYPPR